MNEEEEKAIEDMNRFANGIDMSCVSARQMQIVLNLIEKLLKENEQLKKQVQRQINKWNKDIKSNYISKHEVKDKNMSEEEKEAIEYLKTRLYGNEGCKYIDVAQEDLRIFINLVDRLQNLMEKLQKENKQ